MLCTRVHDVLYLEFRPARLLARTFRARQWIFCSNEFCNRVVSTTKQCLMRGAFIT